MTSSISIKKIQTAVKKSGSIRGAERLLRDQGLSISERSIRRRLQQDEYTISEVPPKIDISELLERRFKEFRERKTHETASFIRTVHVRTNDPIGVGFQGDGHIDNPGADVKQFFEHAAVFDGRHKGMYLGFLGDLTDNWVGRLQALYSKQNTTTEEALALVNHYATTTNFLFYILGNHDCLSLDTELLTRRGWITYSDIRDGDEAFGYNPATGKGEWQPIVLSFKKEHAGEMVHLSTQHVDMMMTPKHRVLHRKHTHSPDWTYSEAAALSGWPAIKCAARMEGEDYQISDDELRLAGWLMTDATVSDKAVVFYQSKPEFVDTIRDLLDRMDVGYTEYARDRQITEICGATLLKQPLTAYEFHVRAGPSRDRCRELVHDRNVLPAWVAELSQRQFDLFFETMMDGDGTWDGKDPDAKNVGTLYKQDHVLDQIHAACVTRGYRSKIKKVSGRNESRLVFTRNNEDSIVTVDLAKKPIKEDAVQDVWCLSVPLTNFMVRRNGKAYFTGNCWNMKEDILQYIFRSTCDIVTAHEQRVKLVFPNGREVMIHARHKFPGHSQWTTQFGQIKAAQLDGQSDIYVGGDKHVSGYSNGIHPGTKKMFHALQVASYKIYDEYPVELGLMPKQLYVCPVAIINPKAKEAVNLIRWEFDPTEGAARLAWERSRNS